MADTWIRDVAEGFLEFAQADWDACMDDHSTTKANGNAVDDFLGPMTPKGTSLLIYSHVVEDVKEIKVKRKREVPVDIIPIPETATAPAIAAASEDGAVTATGDATSQESKEKEAAEQNANSVAGTTDDGTNNNNSSSETTTTTTSIAATGEEKKDDEAGAVASTTDVVVPAAAAAAATSPAAPAFRIIEEEIIERQVTQRTVLACSLKTLPKGVSGIPAVYFVKCINGTISPSGDVNEYMAETVEYGSFAADMLGSIEAIVRHVYSSFLEPQLGGKASSSSSGGGGQHEHSHGGPGGHGAGAGGGGRGSAMDDDGGHDDQSQSMGSPPNSAHGGPGTGGLNGSSGGGGAASVRSKANGGGGKAQSVMNNNHRGSNNGGGSGSNKQHFPAPVAEDRDLTVVADSVRGEFKSALSRFAIVISQTMQQLSADVRITIPSLNNLSDDNLEAAAQDQATIAVLVEAVESWTATIASVCTPVTEGDKGTRPLQEVEFWRGRNARVSTIYDAVQQPVVKTMLNVLEMAREPALDVFNVAFTTLSHAYVEARDNVKFLNTLERHFKNITTGSLSVVADTLPSLLNGLRMVWTISRHYNTDDTMLPLMKRIVNELTDKVASEVNVKYIMRLARTDGEEALSTMTAACAVLDGWHTTYMSVRERIERSSDHRWEFDRRVLFERTDHMSAVIRDLIQAVQVTSEYAKFFRGNELKAITNDPAALNAITKLVDRLTAPLTRLHYSVYDKSKHSKWRAEIQSFDEKVADIDRRTEAFISSAFAHLRSAEGAFDLLAKFDKMDMRDSIRALMEANMSNIVTKARGELAAAAALFHSQKANPPLTKNSPPVAGALAWANALYLRQKRPIVKFRSVPALFASPDGQLLKAEYLAFARSVDAYIKGLYATWCEEAKKSASELLRQSVLGPALLKEPLSASAILAGNYSTSSATGGANASSSSSSSSSSSDNSEDNNNAKGENSESAEAKKLLKSLRRAAAAAASAVATYPGLSTDKDAARMPPPPYTVNLSRNLLTLIREAKLLDRMGYAVPEAAMSAALQEDSLNDYCARLQAMLDRYHGALSALTPVEANLLQVQLARLRTALRPGFTPLNWNSLHVSAYIGDVGKALQDFDSVLSQVRKSCGMLEDAVSTIANSVLLDASEFEGSVGLDVSEVVDVIDRQRNARLEALVHKHKSIKPVMQQVEGIIAGTDTCASAALAEFYRYWERRFYNAITRMILSSMATFEALLNAVTPPAGSGVAPYKRAPLCRIKASYAAPDFILSPDLNYITKFLRRAVHNLINAAKSFTRWMDGTCLEVVVTVPAGEQPPDFSYYEDVKQNPEVVAMLMTLNPAVIRIINNVKRFTGNWSKYGVAYRLWAPRRPEAEKKLIEKAPPANYFDARLGAYTHLAEGVDELAVTKDIGFLRVDCYPVAVAIKTQANKLKSEYGRVLREIGRRKLDEFTTRIQEMRTAIEVKPSDLTSLKNVLQAVALVAESKVDMELLAADAADRYRTLETHGVAVDAGEMEAALLAAKSWQDTVDLALTKDARLVKVKEQFRAVTKTDVEAFVIECDMMKKDFVSTGPTSPGVTLADGLAKLAEYRSKLAEANKRRENFSIAEKLFALPITRYNQLQEIKDEIERVAPLYDLYSEQLAFAESKSSMLWADLDVSSLQKGADELHKRLAKLKDLKGSSVYASVFDEVNGFRESLPLIGSLKNPAMKDRHWEKISQMTGIKINMNPKTFTLGGIFAMKLDRFVEAISEIVNEAKQEGKIEKDLRGIQDKWAASSFKVEKYIKNGELRGHTLKASDELKVELDENLLNLQAMAGSRFVSIFASTVSEWEKKLNLVGETMDVWQVVQTKWQYLEGIFQSEDIRQQLPEEAKRFGAIDKDFKGIMAATSKNPNVVDACCEPGRLELLRTLGEKLDNCQKSLSEYLNTKRNAFARFFFISDDELLSVLGSSDPTSIRVHLLKLFDNVKDFGFGRGNKAITSLASSEGEGFNLREPSPVDGAVEAWMTAAEAEMKSSLQLIVKEGVFNYAHTPRLNWVAEQLGMTVCVGSQIWWTWETEDVFRRVRKGDKHAMKNFAERQTKQLLDLVAKVRDNIPRNHRVKVNTLLIVDVHARDIIDSFVRDSILDAREFAWESQLRFYWDREIDDVLISQCTGNFRYGYEYMGLNGRLVITPLTDRCYMTLTQALTFNLGGAPAGPAGTGKTETTKDLAKNLAIPCFVINCFSEADTQILTNKGFMFLSEVEAYQGKDLQVGGYDPQTQQLLYEEPLARIVNDAKEQTMVEVTSNAERRVWDSDSNKYGQSGKALAQSTFLDDRSTSGISLVMTPNHDIYVKSGVVDANGDIGWDEDMMVCEGNSNNNNKQSLVELPHRKMHASTLLEASESDAVGFVANAPAGIRLWNGAEATSDSVWHRLNLDPANSSHVHHFGTLLGIWLRDGSLQFTPEGRSFSVKFSVAQQRDITAISDCLSVLDVQNVSQSQASPNAAGDVLHVFEVKDKEWVDLFFEEFKEDCDETHVSSHQPGASQLPSPTTTTTTPEGIKWLPSWVHCFDVPFLRSIIAGINIADGKEDTQENVISTSSSAFRDQLLHLFLHAGYSARFGVENDEKEMRGFASSSGEAIFPTTHVSWTVTYSDSTQFCEPVVYPARDAREVKYTGRTWCFTMPHGFLVARRAFRDVATGIVTKASKSVIIGNCGEGLDFRAMGAIFSGLCQVGAWGCFDEFNRISIEVLSVVSAQVKAIQNALNYKKYVADIGFGEIRVDPKVGAFITMNPGYAGRTELPDNLKALFRPVTMIVPDLLQICEIMLFSEGFESARGLAKKMTTLYKLSKEQLSKQKHYDFGLRALKSVLVMAGSLKREFAEMPEDVVLMRSLRDNNMPKFVYEDVPLFQGLIADLFPGLDCPRVGYPQLKAAIEAELEKVEMHHDDEAVYQTQVDKVIQLYEIILTRHTTMIVGPTGGGKSVCINILQRASLAAFGKTIKTFTLNPKAQTVNELYGVMDPATRDWNDGILSKLFRNCNEILPPGKEDEIRWIVFDGDVDAVWVENMNSVMDDNKLLTLPNGERIRLQNYVKLVIEVFDLQYASPATISRCGMTYMDPKNLGFRPFYIRWLKMRCLPSAAGAKQKPTEAGHLQDLFDKYVPKLIAYVLEGDNGKRDPATGAQAADAIEAVVDQVMPQSNLNLCKQLCAMLDATLPTGENGEVEDSEIAEGLFLFALTWSVGACVTVAQRERFNTFLVNLSEGAATAKGLLYESFYDIEGHRWEEWKTRVPVYEPPVPFDFYRVLVPTTDSVLYTYLLTKLTVIEKPVLFVGESGTAKSVTIQNYLGRLEPEKFSVLNINFSSRTTSRDVQTNIEANVDKRSGKTYGPPVGKKLVVFVDDMNMPKVDTYGTQQPIALLLFLVSRGNMYDRGKELDLRTYKDLMFMGAMGPPGGGRNSVDPRFVALFSVFNLTPPTLEVLTKIYGSILTRFVEPFADDVKTAASKLTTATLSLYNTIIEKLPPTPSKFHYIFNLRDLGRVYEGVCLAQPNVINTSAGFIRLWRNEVMRIFGDRLISPSDVALVNTLVADVVRKSYSDCVDVVMADPCLYGDYAMAAERVANDKPDPKLYQSLGTYPEIRLILDKVLQTYNEDRKPMTLVLFEMALEHLTRLLRIIKVPRGNALLVGVGGSGKQSLTRLGAFTAGYKIFDITLVRNYGETELREDLKNLYKMLMAGPVVFLFTDAHVLEEGFLELINNMLTTGMVPALYEKDEIDGIVNQVRKEVKEAGMVDTKENCWGYFVNKARNNLHLVLAMSPSGESLRRRCRNFPGLVSNTVIDWFFAWPEDALERVAEYFLREETLPEEKRVEVVRHMVHVHSSVVEASRRFEAELRRHNYVTPKNYLDFISNYRSQLSQQRGKISTRVRRLEGGLTKLTEASTAVDIMSVELREQKIIVDAKTTDVQALIKDIGERQAIADRQQADAKTKSEELAKAAVIIADESAKAGVALEAALPALEAAAQALDSLNKDDITEIKAFASPPALVMMVCMCIMALRPTGKENEGEGWKGAKAMISDSNFLKALKTYDKDKINDRMIKKVLGYFKEPDFTLEKMKTVSRAGAGLLQWVVAIKEYYGVARDVDPLRKKVADMERQQATGERELEEINGLLSKLSAELSDLDVKYKAAAGELADLTHRAAVMEKRLAAASKLVSGLGSESTRWTADVSRLNGQYVRLVGDCALAASFLSYLGPFTFDYRVQMLDEDWTKDIRGRAIPVTDPFSLEELLITEATVQKWSAEGLPADTHSVYNGILTTRCSRFPLCIDPQQQAVSWLKTREKELKVATFLDGDFMQPLKLAIQYGKPFLFEGVDESIDPMIDPILEQNTFMDGSQRMIMLDDKAIPWDDNFRLYMTSKLANPHYSPEIMGKLQIINYSVTLGGLENQLLNVVVGHERPDLEKQFADLVADMGANATLLEELEESLLRNLASSTGNILDNEELIATLDSAKSKSVEISAKLAQAAITKEDINRTRAGYTPAAKRGSILFFAIAGLSNINAMYETSLASFLVVFRRSLSSAKKANTLELRLKNMVASMTLELYGYTCTGIFERHKLMFSFQMTCMILDGEGTLNRAELDFFLKGDTGLEIPKEKQPYPWLSAAGWKDLIRLNAGLGGEPIALVPGGEKKDPVNPFSDIIADVKTNGAAWRAWYDLEMPEMEPLPSGFSDKSSVFQLLLVMRCFRPDRVYNAVKRFVMTAMGEQFVQPPVLDYSRIYAQMTPSTPAVFILSPGADPQSDIQTLGTQLGFPPPTKFRFLALGQGQAGKAEELLEQGSSRGYWILLQNTHLLISWLKNLEKILASMAKPHQDFRLWMTTDPTDRFPLGILQRSLKVVTEPPDGLKLNMRSVYAKLQADPETANGSECPHPAYKPLVYVLTFTHAVLLERRKFGKIGFNVAYDFNESDFQISRRLLSLYLSKAHANGDEVIPWGSLRYLVGEAMYGGRVSDAFDRRILTTYLDEFMGDFLFDERNKFYFARAGFDYELPSIPASDNISGFTGSVEKLPLTNGPAVFGLHPNAEISYFTAATKALWGNLIDLQPRTGGAGGGVSREEYISGIVRDVQGKLPPVSDVFNIRKRFSEGGAFPSPTQIVLLQELERFNILIETMGSSLTDVARALAGEIGMSDALEDVASALFNAKLPSMWRSLCPDTQKPLGSWMAHFTGRQDQYVDWIDNGDPKIMWLSGLHVPESYLTALVQTTCRRKGWALDRSTLYTSVTTFTKESDVVSRPEDGCYISGLYLEGAGWDLERSCLRRSDPKVLVVELPILQMLPIEATRLKLAGTFKTPVYVTPMRRNAMGVGLVFEADLATIEHPSHWVLQGVALSLNTDQ